MEIQNKKNRFLIGIIIFVIIVIAIVIYSAFKDYRSSPYNLCEINYDEFKVWGTWKHKTNSVNLINGRIVFLEKTFRSTGWLSENAIYKGIWNYDGKNGTLELDFNNEEIDDQLKNVLINLERENKNIDSINYVDVNEGKLGLQIMIDRSECNFEDPYFIIDTHTFVADWGT